MRRRPVITIAAFRPLVVGVLVSVAAVVGGCGGLSCDDYKFPAEVWKVTNYKVKNSEDEVRERRRAADALGTLGTSEPHLTRAIDAVAVVVDDSAELIG